MRDPNRLDKFYREFRRIHKKYFPDWRFGQFICNFFGWIATEHKIDCFFPEEDRMLNFLREYVEDDN